METNLIEVALDDGKFDSFTFTCPDCEGYADDPQYTCTTCYCHPGEVFSVADVISMLLKRPLC